MSELQQDDGGYLIEQEDDLPETEGQLESEESEEPGSESAPDSGNSAHEKQVEFTEAIAALVQIQDSTLMIRTREWFLWTR